MTGAPTFIYINTFEIYIYNILKQMCEQLLQYHFQIHHQETSVLKQRQKYFHLTKDPDCCLLRLQRIIIKPNHRTATRVSYTSLLRIFSVVVCSFTLHWQLHFKDIITGRLKKHFQVIFRIIQKNL